MNTATTSAGQSCRDDIEEFLARVYPDTEQRSGIVKELPTWSPQQIDNALSLLRKRCTIARIGEGYSLVTAPDSYNRELLEKMNSNKGENEMITCDDCGNSYPTGFEHSCPAGVAVPVDEPEEIDGDCMGYADDTPAVDLRECDPACDDVLISELNKLKKKLAPTIDSELKTDVLERLAEVVHPSIAEVLDRIIEEDISG